MLKWLILKLIRLYQKSSLFLTDGVCRFTPTCSEYTYQAISRYGIIRGTYLSLKRIIRCHPFSKGGYDPIK